MKPLVLDIGSTLHTDSFGNRIWYKNGTFKPVALSKIDNKEYKFDKCPKTIHGTKMFGTLHRTYGPALEWNSGSWSWWLDGNLHRIGGPAMYFTSGYDENNPPLIRDLTYYIHGKLYRPKEEYYTALELLKGSEASGIPVDI